MKIISLKLFLPYIPKSSVQRTLNLLDKKVIRQNLTVCSRFSKIDQNIVEQLERVSLVDFANKRGIERLQEAINFANQICDINTEGVKPLVTVLEDRCLYLREDVVSEGGYRKDVLANAAVTEEEYFVSPPGNIPLEPQKKSFA